MVNAANYRVWIEKVKFKLEAYGFDVCKIVCEGSGNDPMSMKVH